MSIQFWVCFFHQRKTRRTECWNRILTISHRPNVSHSRCRNASYRSKSSLRIQIILHPFFLWTIELEIDSVYSSWFFFSCWKKQRASCRKLPSKNSILILSPIWRSFDALFAFLAAANWWKFGFNWKAAGIRWHWSQRRIQLHMEMTSWADYFCGIFIDKMCHLIR